jgi:hypothetical protein
MIRDLTIIFAGAFVWEAMVGEDLGLLLIGCVALAAWASYRLWKRERDFRRDRTVFVEERRRR